MGQAMPSASPRLMAAGIFVAALCLLPLVYLAVRGVETGTEAFSIMLRPRTLQVLLNTLQLALAVTCSATLIGVLLAWLTSRTDLPCRRFWTAATCLPLALPSYVSAFALIAAFGPRGMLQHLLEPLGVGRLPSFYGFPAAWLALTLCAYPYVLLSVRAGLRGIDPSMEDAARSLGRGNGRVFREVILPHLRPAMGAGALLVALYTLSDFGAVSLLRFNAFTREIHVQYSASLDRSAAAVLALMLVMLTLVILVVEQRTRGKSRRYQRAGVGARRAARTIRLGVWRWPSLIFCAVVCGLGAGLPVAVVVYWLVQGWGSGQAFTGWWGLLSNSVTVSTLAGMACLVAALPVALLAVRHPGRRSRMIERLVYVGHGLPGIVVALALVFLGARQVPWLYQTLPLLVMAYVVLFLSLAVGAMRASLLHVSPRLEEAARTLGRTPFQALRSVTFPLLRPGMWTAFAMVFLTSMKELPATLVLGPIGFQTLATRIWGATEEAFFARAAAPALILTLISAISLWIILSHEETQSSP
jgi:iron(III) transport system permease protein